MYSPLKRKPTLMPAVALAALGALVAFPALSQSRLYAAAPERFANVTVVAGQNLWTIAGRYTSEDGNVQDTIDAIMAANKMKSSTLVPGERLKIPR